MHTQFYQTVAVASASGYLPVSEVKCQHHKYGCGCLLCWLGSYSEVSNDL